MIFANDSSGRAREKLWLLPASPESAERLGTEAAGFCENGAISWLAQPCLIQGSEERLLGFTSTSSFTGI